MEWYQDNDKAIKNINKRLGDLEAKLGECGSKVGFKQMNNLRERLNALETAWNNYGVKILREK